MSTFTNHYNMIQAVNEVYFGKSKELQHAERLMGEFRRRHMGETTITAAQADPVLKKWEQCMADIFGFKNYVLSIQSERMANSATYAVGCTFNGLTTKVKSTPSGFKYDPPVLTMIQIIYPYILFDEIYTDAEIMAICLHEIGHNFSHKRSALICVDHIIKAIIIVPLSILAILTGHTNTGVTALLNLTTMGRELQALLDQKLYVGNIGTVCAIYDSLVQSINSIPSIVASNINVIINPFIFLTNMLPNIIRKAAPQLLNPIGFISGTADERYSDQFATMYGYGPELASGLQKMGDNAYDTKSAIHKVPVLGWIYDLVNIPFTWMMSVLDVHPTHASRRKTQYNYLMAEMDKDGMPPAIKKEVQNEITRMEEYMTAFDEAVKPYEGNIVSVRYNAIMSKLAKGDDPREYLVDINADVKGWDDMHKKGSRR